MKKNMSSKFMDESSVTFHSSVSGPGEFGLTLKYLKRKSVSLAYLQSFLFVRGSYGQIVSVHFKAVTPK